MTATTIRVGFVGIGNMGWPMARNMLAAAFALHAFAADPARTARFAIECGGSGASSVEALGRECDLVVTMLPNGHDVRMALLGAVGDADGGGLVSSLQPGAIVV